MDYQLVKLSHVNNDDDTEVDRMGLVNTDTLPDEIREIARCRSPIIAWTTLDPTHAREIDRYAFCNQFGIFLWMPFLWPHLALMWPFLWFTSTSAANGMRSQYWILTETELKVVSESYDVCCNTGFRQSGDSVQTIPLENITDCGVQARQTGCAAQCVAPVPSIYVDTASATPGKMHEATGVALAGYEAFIGQVLQQRDVVKGSYRGSSIGGGLVASSDVVAVMDRGDRSAAERIREISELYKNEILTRAEFDAKRQEIIDSI